MDRNMSPASAGFFLSSTLKMEAIRFLRNVWPPPNYKMLKHRTTFWVCVFLSIITIIIKVSSKCTFSELVPA
jgi:hypothetical protein